MKNKTKFEFNCHSNNVKSISIPYWLRYEREFDDIVDHLLSIGVFQMGDLYSLSAAKIYNSGFENIGQIRSFVGRINSEFGPDAH